MTVAPAAAATLDVLVAGVRNATGKVRVAVCSEARFLGTDCEFTAEAPAHPGDTLVRVAGVPPGIWAVQAFHDENLNTVLDRNLLGLPTEGLGFSNDAKFNFGPPRWGDAAFRLEPPGGHIRLSLRYLF